jgi:DNA-binding CsgD family transcriptional regulator
MFAASAYLGASMVHRDRVEEGMVLLDEALAATAAGEVKSFLVVEQIFCQLFAACEYARDVRRAEQWIRVGDQVAARRNLPAVSAYCHTHYGAVLTAAGRWREADAALTEAVRLWALGARTLKADALARLADLRVRQGRYDEAAHLLEGLGDHGDATRPLAALQLAQGHVAVATELLERAVQQSDPASISCVPLLALLVDAQVKSGEDPAGTLDAMSACADAHPGPYPRALVALARGRVALATGDGDPRAWLRDALDGFTRASLPLEAALCRLELAHACEQSSPEVAVAEARAALEAFAKLEAARLADEAVALLRRLGERIAPARPGGEPLTRREQEVLRLVGEGRSNPEIAAALFISRKTVEHHVGNILSKLGLRNRAEAAAYSVRQEPASQ